MLAHLVALSKPSAVCVAPRASAIRASCSSSTTVVQAVAAASRQVCDGWGDGGHLV